VQKQSNAHLLKSKVSEILLNKTRKTNFVKRHRLDTDYKIFICGHPFTGKNTLAKKIVEKFVGLKLVHFHDLIHF